MTPHQADRCQRGREPVIREDGSIEIPLGRDRVSVISQESYLLVKDHLWRAAWDPDTRSFYARATVLLADRIRHTCSLHRTVIGAPTGTQVDHINHDTLDNRLSNLRLATASENARNRRRSARNTSGYKGITWHRNKRLWQVRIGIDGGQRFIGLYADREDAKLARDAAARRIHGEFACAG